MVVCRLIAEASVKELPLTEETIQAKTNESNWLKCTPNLWFIMVQGEKERERGRGIKTLSGHHYSTNFFIGELVIGRKELSLSLALSMKSISRELSSPT